MPIAGQVARAGWESGPHGFLHQANQDGGHCWGLNPVRHYSVRARSMDATLPGEEARRPAPLRAPGNRSQLVLFRSRGDYGCVWTTCARRTDAPVAFRFTRITGWGVAARNRWARFPAAQFGGALRNAPAAEPPRPAVDAEDRSDN